MKRDIRLIAKFALMLFGCFLFLYLAGKAVVRIVEPVLEKEHTYITLQEAGNLVWLLADTASDTKIQLQTDPEKVLSLLQNMNGDQETLLTFQKACELVECLPESLEAMPEGYGQQELVRTSDFFIWFDHAKAIYDPEGKITEQELLLLGTGKNVKNADGEPITEDCVMTKDGAFTVHTPLLLEERFQYRNVTAITCGTSLYAVRAFGSGQEITVPNVWVLSADDDGILFFWNEHEIRIDSSSLKQSIVSAKKEFIADMFFDGGKVIDLCKKEEKISGKILKITQEGVEVEGYGFFEYAENPRFYQLYGRMASMTAQDLRIGYAFTDFVLENGRIAAGLTVKEESMEYIRVLIQNAGYGGRIHDTVTLYADCACTLYYEEDGKIKSRNLEAGKSMELDGRNELFKKSGRIRIVPDILTGKIYLPEVTRSRESGGYRGCMEVSLHEDGLLLVNEILLEEYLYAVVPSEMPASYPAEALKSQAICARTYAYEKMCHAGLAEYGAHLDDSTAFQVYRNQEEQEESSRAVRETAGKTLFWKDEAAEVFYYSTSSGFGTDARVWDAGNAEKYPYLLAQAILDPVSGEYYEQDEPWYRWNCRIEQIRPEQILKRIQTRYQANPSTVLTQMSDGSFCEAKPELLGDIEKIQIISYGDGNVAKELMICGKECSYLISTEYNIRYVLCDGETEVIRQDGTALKMTSILPSAFLLLETQNENGIVTSYEIKGGGYGHGVGMSQNGARNMAAQGMKCEEILSFFYRGCDLRDIYQ